MTYLRKTFLAFLLALALPHGAPGAATLPNPTDNAEAYLKEAATRLCRAYDVTAAEMALLLGEVTILHAQTRNTVLPPDLDRTVFLERQGSRLVVDRWMEGAALLNLAAEYHAPSPIGQPKPLLRVTLDAQCMVTGGQRLSYDSTGRVQALDTYGNGLKKLIARTELNPPIPAGRDRAGVTVAFLGTGVDYTTPEIATRLARAPNGQPLGYDFADGDARPFDVDPRSSPFAPRPQDTAAVQLLLKEASQARLLPYRYAPAHMPRAAEAVDAAAGNGARVVLVTVGGDSPEDWEPFVLAARAQPHILFVVAAGDRERNIDDRPYFPASASVPNFLVVTAATEGGEIYPAANWGAEQVHLLVSVPPMEIKGLDGRKHWTPGSVTAAARTAALAVRLAHENPKWRAPELKAAILDLATPLNEERRVRHGWIATPDA